MSASAVPRRRVLVLVPLLLVALLAWWATRADSEAAPSAPSRSASQAGKIAFDSLPGGVKVALPVRSFSVGGVNTSSPVGGGGGAGKFVPDDPTVVIDAADVDPLLLRMVTTGVHLQTATVTLFRPGTTVRQETWLFTDVTVSALHTTQAGSAKPPRVSFGLHYTRVVASTFEANGALASSYCFALDSNSSC